MKNVFIFIHIYKYFTLHVILYIEHKLWSPKKLKGPWGSPTSTTLEDGPKLGGLGTSCKVIFGTGQIGPG